MALLTSFCRPGVAFAPLVVAGLVAAASTGVSPARANEGLRTVRELQRHQQALFDRAAGSVVFISSGGHFGSGFFVDRHGLILTNAHVVAKRAVVKVVRHDGTIHEGRVVQRAQGKLDLALVQIEADSNPLLLDVTGLSVGAWVAAIGHGEGGAWTYTTGMVSNIYSDEESRSVFQTQIPLNPGASGGPVFDLEGHVLGIVMAGIEGVNSINFAIRADDAQRAFPRLRRGSAANSVLSITAPAGVAIFVDGNHVGEGPEVALAPAAGLHEVMAVIEGRMVRRTVRWPGARRVVLH